MDVKELSINELVKMSIMDALSSEWPRKKGISSVKAVKPQPETPLEREARKAREYQMSMKAIDECWDIHRAYYGGE